MLGLRQRGVERRRGGPFRARLPQRRQRVTERHRVGTAALLGRRAQLARALLQAALRIGRPALQRLQGFGLQAQDHAQPVAQRLEGGALLGLQPGRRQGRPVPVERGHPVHRQLRVVRERLRLRQQRLGLSPGLALGHGGLQPLLGQAVHLAVVGAELALGLAQRALAGQRLHGGQLDGQQRGRLRHAQQGGVVALRRRQPSGPIDLGRRRRRRAARRQGRAGRARAPGRARLGARLGRRRRRSRGRRGRSGCAAFLEEPAQHGVVVARTKEIGGVGREGRARARFSLGARQ